MPPPATSPSTSPPRRRGLLTRTGFRLPFLLAGGLALLGGLDAGLALLGLPPLYFGGRLAEVHGPLMVLGFVGTLISLERAVALDHRWGYAAPVISGLGAVATLLGLGSGPMLLVLAQGLTLLVYRALATRHAAAYLSVQLLGQTLALAAAFMWWLGLPMPAVVPWFVGFLVLTIWGERIELSRFGGPGRHAELLALWGVGLVTVAVVTTLVWPPVGFTILGVALLAVAGWLFRYDVARRTINATGLPRFIAGCLLVGYGWLAVSGGVWALGGNVTGRGYDAAVHAVLLGFVLTMIMAHAPVIMPAVLRRPLPYHPSFIVPAVLLQASLLLRLAVGDAHDLTWALRWGGALNVTAVLAFIAVAAVAAGRAGTTTEHTAPREKV